MTLGDRLKQVRLEKGWTQTKLADEASKYTDKPLLQQHIYNIESRSSNTTKYLTAFANALGVSSQWLDSGMGNKEIGAENFNPETQAVDAWDDDTPLDDQEFEVPHYAEVHVAAGSSEGIVQEKTDRKIRLAKSSARKAGAQMETSFSYNITGDSMKGRIEDGSRCTADSSKKSQIKDGKIYVLRYGVLRLTKYVYRRPDGGLTLKSENEDYAPVEIDPCDLDQVEILGWVWDWSTMDRWN